MGAQAGAEQAGLGVEIALGRGARVGIERLRERLAERRQGGAARA
jgi:hypothetical protein